MSNQPETPIRRRALISGRVQGVFFRDSTRRRARELGLSGWVRNRRDGRVELVVEGPPQAVEALLAWAEEGPPHADVSQIEIEPEAPEGTVDSFSVRH